MANFQMKQKIREDVTDDHQNQWIIDKILTQKIFDLPVVLMNVFIFKFKLFFAALIPF